MLHAYSEAVKSTKRLQFQQSTLVGKVVKLDIDGQISKTLAGCKR